MLVLKKKEPKLGRDTDPLGNPSESVAKAHALLKRAVEKSVQVPSDVVAAVTDAHHSIARTGGFTDAELETRFWNAYGLLSSIRPVEEDRARYKRLFYWLLGVLLICQLYYLAGSLVSKRLADVEAEWRNLPAAPQAAVSNQAEEWAKLRRRATAQANYVLATNLLLLVFREFADDELQLSAEATAAPQDHKISPELQKFTYNYMKLKGELEVVLCALSGYILPLLYGALGAFAFILRKLSDPVGKLTYAYDTRVSYTLRLHIGALGGLAVGWFINGNAPISGLGGSAASGLVALSPLALAFVAGYASDLLFTALDKVVAAFSPLPSSQSSLRTEATFGGMTVTTETQREARVAGGAVSAPLLPEPAARPDPGKPAEPDQVKPHEPRPRAA
jgi:hypothetical protein